MVWECLLKYHSKSENRWDRKDFLRTGENNTIEDKSSVMRMIWMLKMPRQHKRAGDLWSWEQGHKWNFFNDVPFTKNFCEHAGQWSMLWLNHKRLFFSPWRSNVNDSSQYRRAKWWYYQITYVGIRYDSVQTFRPLKRVVSLLSHTVFMHVCVHITADI